MTKIIRANKKADSYRDRMFDPIAFGFGFEAVKCGLGLLPYLLIPCFNPAK